MSINAEKKLVLNQDRYSHTSNNNIFASIQIQSNHN